MPEGPSIVILKDAVQSFNCKKIIGVTGNSKVDQDRLKGNKVQDFKSWGKHFLICFDGFFLRVHFLLFGSYRINERKETPPRLSLAFRNGELNLYACAIRLVESDADEVYDWTADVMNDKWDPKKARKKLKDFPKMLACDALLNQDIFAGVGNIIKNEVLFRIRLHPKSKIGNIPPRKLTGLINQARIYSFDFLEWKKQFVLKKHLLAHTKRTCARCRIPLVKEYSGKQTAGVFFAIIARCYIKITCCGGIGRQLRKAHA